MDDIAFSFSVASLAAFSCLQNLCDLLIIRGALYFLFYVPALFPLALVLSPAVGFISIQKFFSS